MGTRVICSKCRNPAGCARCERACDPVCTKGCSAPLAYTCAHCEKEVVGGAVIANGEVLHDGCSEARARMFNDPPNVTPTARVLLDHAKRGEGHSIVRSGWRRGCETCGWFISVLDEDLPWGGQVSLQAAAATWEVGQRLRVTIHHYPTRHRHVTRDYNAAEQAEAVRVNPRITPGAFSDAANGEEFAARTRAEAERLLDTCFLCKGPRGATPDGKGGGWRYGGHLDSYHPVPSGCGYHKACVPPGGETNGDRVRALQESTRVPSQEYANRIDEGPYPHPSDYRV